MWVRVCVCLYTVCVYGVGCERATTFGKEIVPVAHFADGLIGRMSLHDHDADCVTFKFGIDPTSESHTVSMNVAPWQLSTWSPPPSCKMDWMD